MFSKRTTATVLLSAIGAVFTHGTAHADPVQSPALIAKYNTYTTTGPSQPAFCFNGFDPPQACSVSGTRLGTGSYEITVTNGRPFTEFFDVGHAIFVTAVGNNVLCRETAMWTSGNNLKSRIRCVTPAGTSTDTPFSWFYRADSFLEPQYSSYVKNFAYARSSRLNPSEVRSTESFTTYNEAGGHSGGHITNQRLSTGRHKVTFLDATAANSEAISPLGLGNVQAVPTCANDNTSACHRSLCRVYSLTDTGADTEVEVRCYSNGVARDTDFRVFLGGESHSNQIIADDLADPPRGNQFGWARVPDITTADGCLSTSSFQHFNQHTDTLGDVSRELRVCRQSTGVFRVNFNSHGGFYKGDSVSGIFSTRTANTYCNMGKVSCGDALCGGGQNVYIDVYCYDQAGSPVNTAFNMSIIYH